MMPTTATILDDDDDDDAATSQVVSLDRVRLVVRVSSASTTHLINRCSLTLYLAHNRRDLLRPVFIIDRLSTLQLDSQWSAT